MKKLVIFDIDGVLADFEGAVDKELVKIYRAEAYCDRSLFRFEDRYIGKTEIKNSASKMVEDPNFYYGLKPCEGSANFLGEVLEKYEVVYVSSRPEQTLSFTRRWIRKSTFDQDPLVFCGVKDKASFLIRLEELGNVIIYVVEDNPEQIESLKDAGYMVYCWSQPWNEEIFPRLYVRSDGEVMLWENEFTEATPFLGEGESE